MPCIVIAIFLVAALLTGCGKSSGGEAATTSVPETTVAPVAEMASCPKYRASVNVGTIKDPQLDELSGLATSARNPGVMWAHNDSGDVARVFAIKQSGELVSTVSLSSTTVLDVEDIAVSRGARSEVWLADIGDNLRFRGSVDLYHFPEPDASESITVEPQHVRVRYQVPGGTDTYSIDAESFFLDRQNNGYIVEKTQDKKLAWVFQLAAADLQSGSATARPIAQITGNSDGQGVGPTGADMSADGTTLAIKSYSETFIWRFSARSSVPTVLEKNPDATCIVAAGRGEAITFAGPDLITVEEGVGKPIRRTSAR